MCISIFNAPVTAAACASLSCRLPNRHTTTQTHTHMHTLTHMHSHTRIAHVNAHDAAEIRVYTEECHICIHTRYTDTQISRVWLPARGRNPTSRSHDLHSHPGKDSCGRAACRQFQTVLANRKIVRALSQPHVQDTQTHKQTHRHCATDVRTHTHTQQQHTIVRARVGAGLSTTQEPHTLYDPRLHHH